MAAKGLIKAAKRRRLEVYQEEDAKAEQAVQTYI
jgi:hypothetical protein